MARSLGGTFTTAHHSGQESIPRTQLLLHLQKTNELTPKIAIFERRYMFKRKTSFLVSMLDFGAVNGVKSLQSILVQLIKKDSVFWCTEWLPIIRPLYITRTPIPFITGTPI